MSAPGTSQVVLAIDGGNIKTDVALVGAEGQLLSLIRGGTSSPHVLGLDGCLALLTELVGEACAAAGLDRDGRDRSGGATGQRAGGGRATPEPIADVARILLAGADLPEEVEALQGALGAIGWSPGLVVENDTLALLRTGTDRGWGVAVVCGGGINAVGIAPDGRAARFPALGAITGDWGGGHDVGVTALGVANRSADGRVPRSTLEWAVPRHFGMSTPLEVARAVHYKEISLEALAQLTPVVYQQAAVDDAAREILARVAEEVAVLASTALRRLELCDAGADVVLGGGLMRAAPRWMIELIEQRVHATSAGATVVLDGEGPIVGATILALDAIGAGAVAVARARAELQEAISGLSRQPVA